MDPARFQDGGVNFKAKLIGVESVPDARGDKMCQDAMQKLKGMVKTAKAHKPKITVNVSLEGLKIIDEISQVSTPMKLRLRCADPWWRPVRHLLSTLSELKVIPSGHSSVTWCYMASMWCLPTNVQKEWCVGFHYRNDKESHTFQ